MCCVLLSSYFYTSNMILLAQISIKGIQLKQTQKDIPGYVFYTIIGQTEVSHKN